MWDPPSLYFLDHPLSCPVQSVELADGHCGAPATTNTSLQDTACSNASFQPLTLQLDPSLGSRHAPGGSWVPASSKSSLVELFYLVQNTWIGIWIRISCALKVSPPIACLLTVLLISPFQWITFHEKWAFRISESVLWIRSWGIYISPSENV